MNLKTLKKMLLFSTLIGVVGVAYAAYSTTTEAIDAARPLYQKGDYVGAQKLSEEALKLAKTPSEKVAALIRIGATYNKRNLNVQARTQWARILELPGASGDDKIGAQSLIATSYGEEKNWPQARIESQKIIDSPDATAQNKYLFRFVIATAYVAENNAVEARKALASIADDTTLDSNLRAPAYDQLGQGFFNAREFERGRTTLRTALGLPGLSTELAIPLQAKIALSYNSEGNVSKAQEAFGQAQVMALRQAKQFAAAKQFQSARASMEQALDLGEMNPALDIGVRMEIAQYLLAEGKPALAREKFEAVLKQRYEGELSPQVQTTLRETRQSANIGLARSYIQEKNGARAKEVLNALLAANSLYPGARDTARKLLTELG